MGRIFEKRKHKIFARMDRMAKAFTRIGKDIAIAVKEGGAHPETNPRLRMAMQNAKGVGMPKDRVEAAIKRAVSKDTSNYEEVVYEGYAPHGIALVIETATDNTTRTVANIRSYLTRANGSLSKTGSLDFLFNRVGIFKLKKEGINMEEMELELIDMGAEEIQVDEEEIIIQTTFQNFGQMARKMEEKGIVPISAELVRIPTTTKELPEAQVDEVMELIAKIEEDDDVNQVFHNLA